MPARIEIFKEITQQRGLAQDEVRRKYLKNLVDYTGRDTILVSSAFTSKKFSELPSFVVSLTNQDIQGFMSALHGLKGDKLDLIIHSPGGLLETAEQIVSYLRQKYTEIRAIIPQNAMSVATMISCACDKIIMGKHSALGPIDPQITISTQTGHYTAPAQSILDEFELAKKEVTTNPDTAPIWIRRIDKYPIGFLQICDNTIKLSKQIVREWLKCYMLKNSVNKEKIANEISEWLGDTNFHKSHGRPIGIKELISHGMEVEPLEADDDLQDKVLSVFHAAMATHEFTDCTKFIENQNGKGYFFKVKVERLPNK